MEINKTYTKIFGYDNVSYSGEPIGILVGPDEKIVNELIDKVSVNFDIESLESALKNVIRQQKKPIVNLNESGEVNSKNQFQSDKENSSEFSNFLNQINELPSLDIVLDKNHVEDKTQKTVAFREIKSGLYKELSIEEAETQLFSENKDVIISTESWEEKLSDPSWQETNGAFCYFDNKNLHELFFHLQ